MKTPTLSLIAATLLVLATSMRFAAASDAGPRGPLGEWRVADGSANVAIRPCGPDLCGFISWTKDPGDVVGREILIDMKPVGALWSGTVLNVVDGQKYDARISLLSDDVLKIEGCAMGGAFCGDQQWSRVSTPERRQSRAESRVRHVQARNRSAHSTRVSSRSDD
jgi:uncharacterized protein (DUF2147 family)